MIDELYEASPSDISEFFVSDSDRALYDGVFDDTEFTVFADSDIAAYKIYTELQMINQVQLYIFVILIFFSIFSLMKFFMNLIERNITNHF